MTTDNHAQHRDHGQEEPWAHSGALIESRHALQKAS
jgi:hypothetical protein